MHTHKPPLPPTIRNAVADSAWSSLSVYCDTKLMAVTISHALDRRPIIYVYIYMIAYPTLPCNKACINTCTQMQCVHTRSRCIGAYQKADMHI